MADPGPALLVIGAGPKAMALAAKAAALADLGFRVPKVRVVERTGVGANWTGKAGYTHGHQPLGTGPEKDVGFPYDSRCWGPDLAAAVGQRMLRYSWTSFLVDHDQYSDWIDRGRPAPEHHQWARYLQWVSARVGGALELCLGEARRISLAAGRWEVEVVGDAGFERVAGDGLVLTGPGKVRLPQELPRHERVLTVETFWPLYARLAALDEGRIVIVGTGETSAAVAMSLVQLGKRDLEIQVVSPLGMAYSRGESFRENRVYSDPAHGNWSLLTPQHRRDFIRRTDRGVFSQASLRLLDQSDALQVVAGRLEGLRIGPDGRPVLALCYNEQRSELACDWVVLGTGADHLALFRELVDPAAEAEVLARTGLAALEGEAVEELIDYDLSVRGLEPKLYLPMLAGLNQGPGFANLSCLGRLSDRILELLASPPDPA